MNTTIRLATADDAGTIFELINELARVQGCTDDLPASPESLRRQMLSQKPPFECLLAEDASGPIGHALFFQNYSTWEGKPGIYLEDLYVRPSVQGHGVGRAFMQFLANLAAERGCARIDWTVLDTNRSGQEFYSRIGARPLAQWHHWRLDSQAIKSMATRALSSKA
jgi:GNAT superfamily N-acetyltransferase